MNPIVSQEGAASCKYLGKETLKTAAPKEAAVFVFRISVTVLG